jgi:hypothetical protein
VTMYSGERGCRAGVPLILDEVGTALVQFGGLPIFQRPDGLKAARWLGS